MSQQRLDDALAQLVRAELIYRRGAPPNAEYTFKHALVQDTAYSTLLRSKRQQIHIRIAATLESQFPEVSATLPQLIAHHCTEAGLSEKAVSYWLNVGQQAIAHSAMREAEAQLGKGLDLIRNLPQGAECQQYELNLQIAYGRTLRATKGFAAPAVSASFARARDLCEALDRPSQLGVVMTGQWSYHLGRGEIVRSCQLANELLELGQSRDDVSLKLAGYRCGTVSWFHLGEFGEARAYAEQATGPLQSPAYPTCCT